MRNITSIILQEILLNFMKMLAVLISHISANGIDHDTQRTIFLNFQRHFYFKNILIPFNSSHNIRNDFPWNVAALLLINWYKGADWNHHVIDANVKF